MSKRQSKRTSHGYQSSEDEVEQFLDEVFTFPKDNDPRVRVTLTFAQSLDGKIAGANGKQLTLSCKESMHMTHMYASLSYFCEYEAFIELGYELGMTQFSSELALL